jgi:hypothetical protein
MTHRTLTAAVTIAAACAFTINASAQTTKTLDEKKQLVRQERVVESFKTSLKSDYPGVVEGTIYNIVIYKKYYPQLDYTDLVAALNQYSLDNDDIALRYKAHLASLYLSNTTTIEIEPVAHPADHEYIFRQIAQQLETKFLVAK